jgi:hypothetical protein
MRGDKRKTKIKRRQTGEKGKGKEGAKTFLYRLKYLSKYSENFM